LPAFAAAALQAAATVTATRATAWHRFQSLARIVVFLVTALMVLCKHGLDDRQGRHRPRPPRIERQVRDGLGGLRTRHAAERMPYDDRGVLLGRVNVLRDIHIPDHVDGPAGAFEQEQTVLNYPL